MISSDYDDLEFRKINNYKYLKNKKDFHRNIYIYEQKDFSLMSDSEKYEIVKHQLQLITRGERKSKEGEVEYLKSLLKELKGK